MAFKRFVPSKNSILVILPSLLRTEARIMMFCPLVNTASGNGLSIRTSGRVFTVIGTAVEVVAAPTLLVALAEITKLPGGMLLHVTVYGGVVLAPIKFIPA